MYELVNVDKLYNNFYYALKKVNLKIQKGNIVVIMGPSGSGKTTLLNILGGIDRPSRGKLLFKNQEISNYTCYRKDNIGFIFQSCDLISNLTVLENILLSKNLVNDYLDLKQIIDVVGLTKEKNKYPYQLSGGQKQKVMICKALVKNPQVILADEPTGSLDEESGQKIIDLLYKISKKFKKTLVIVTHNPNFKKIADVLVSMNSGKITSVKEVNSDIC